MTYSYVSTPKPPRRLVHIIGSDKRETLCGHPVEGGLVRVKLKEVSKKHLPDFLWCQTCLRAKEALDELWEGVKKNAPTELGREENQGPQAGTGT